MSNDGDLIDDLNNDSLDLALQDISLSHQRSALPKSPAKLDALLSGDSHKQPKRKVARRGDAVCTLGLVL